MVLTRFVTLLLTLIMPYAMASPPHLYHQAAYQSPVRGDPDDLLLLAGYGFALDDTVIYHAVEDTTRPTKLPNDIPRTSNAEFGVAPVVSAADVPYSLTIRLPRVMRARQSYRIWVRTAGGQWSEPIEINDARPLWVSPAYAYASHPTAGLPREVKIVGRNLRSSLGHSTLLRMEGPQPFTAAALSSSSAVEGQGDYVARFLLPPRLRPGTYRMMVSRDGASWVEVEGQLFEVRPDRLSAAKFLVSDARFGGCRPDDGVDDTECIVRAIEQAARAGGGTVYFEPGTWDFKDGILVPLGVDLQGAGSALTRLDRHPEWHEHGPRAAFTLLGHTFVSGFTFHDPQIYQPNDRSSPYLQLGEDWQQSLPSIRRTDTEVTEVAISNNVFDKPYIAIGTGGLPINHLVITNNVFGAYHAALELSGDQYNLRQKFRIDDSVIDSNIFKPGSELDLVHQTGTLASELGAGHRLDFSENVADGSAADFLYSRDDAKGWRAAFFWSPNDNIEQVLVSQNTATCTGDKIGDGEAFAFDNNLNTFAFAGASTVVRATATTLTVSLPLASRQHERDVPIATYYIGHWVQIVSGRGLGQARKIVGYLTNPVTQQTLIQIAPAWDIAPEPGLTRIAIGREYAQVYVVGNRVDNRQPLCQKSNRSRHQAGVITFWSQSVDSVIAENSQFDSDGIFVHQVYVTAEHPCPNCTMQGHFHSFLEIRDNLIDGEYDWSNDCSRSGIAVGVAAAPWEPAAPPTVGFGVSIAHNFIRHADGQYGGAISQLATWYSGPAPHRWPLSDNLLIHHNVISDIDGSRATPICGTSRPRIGIAFPDDATAWRTVLYANSCRNVSKSTGDGGIGTVKVCPSSMPDSCECSQAAR